MIVRRFELLLPGETNVSMVFDRFLQRITPLEELERNPSWRRRKLVGRVEWGVLYWQCLALPILEQLTSPWGRATLERLDDGIQVVATIELRTIAVIAWGGLAAIAVIMAVIGSPLPLLFTLTFVGFRISEIESLRRALSELLIREGPEKIGPGE